MKILISIIIPVYNREALIAETLDCLIAQSFKDWECIIVDDGSKDNTASVVWEYVNKDLRFQFYKRPSHLKKGAASCRNYAFQKATGNFIQYLDSDDVISENKLEEQVSSIHGEQKLMATCAWHTFKKLPVESRVSEMDKFIPSGIYQPLKILQILGELNSYLPVHSYLTPRYLIKEAGPWNENLSNNDDAEFFIRVLCLAEKIHVNDKVMAFYRKMEGDNLSGYSNRKKLDSVVLSWKLIEAHLLQVYGSEASPFIESSKKRLYRNIRWENPELINSYSKFFQKYIRQRKREQRKNLLKQLLRKFKKRLNL